MSSLKLTRREFSVASLATLGASAMPSLAHAKAPFLETRAPAFYTFMHGSMQITVVSDGPLPIGDASKVILGTPKDELAATLKPHFQSADGVVLQQNALVVNTGDKLVLIDTGLGPIKMFGEQTGRLGGNLAAAGINPKDIDAVLLSHAHPDHLGGLINAAGESMFPNAEIHLTKADYDFWTNDANGNDQIKGMITAAQQSLRPHKDRMKFIEPGKEAVPGITALAAPGHTVGHVVFMLASEGKTLCNIADIAHHPVLIVERPTLEFAYDSDPKQGVATRIKIFDMLATDGIAMIGYHFPWPGIGHISKQGDGFRYYPEQIDMMPLSPKKG